MLARSLVTPSAVFRLPNVVIGMLLEALAMCAFSSFVVVTLQFSVQCAADERAARLSSSLGQYVNGLEQMIV
jgi:hypothetical protein